MYNKKTDLFVERWKDLFLEKSYGFFRKNMDGNSILDVGCGSGRDVHRFVSDGFESIGIDLSKEMVKYAKHNQRGSFFRMDMRKLEFESDIFDGVWCNSSLHHLPKEDAGKALDEFKRVLKPGGILFVTVKEGSGEEIDKEGRFLVYYSIEELEKLLEERRFQVISRYQSESRTGKWIELFAIK